MIFIADRNVATLLDFQFRHTFAAGRGGHGGSNNKTGKRGENYIIRIPVGTVVMEADGGRVLRDMSHAEEEAIIAHGGAGGRGNANIIEATEGNEGEKKLLRLELKLIADVGLVGFPNAGKSSMLARISTARPKVAAYPFTTRYPVLGVVTVGERQPFVACDIPGLIEGAHEGRGLGFEFLRHIERTRLLVHLIDLSSADGRDPVEAYHQLNAELESYSPALVDKPQLVIANKIDVPDAKERLEAFETAIGQRVWPVSCVTGEGLTPMLHAVMDALDAVRSGKSLDQP